MIDAPYFPPGTFSGAKPEPGKPAGAPLMVLPANASPTPREPLPVLVTAPVNDDSFVPFAFHDDSIMIEVRSNPAYPDNANANVCTLVILYRGERFEYSFGVSMLRGLFERATATWPYHSFTMPLDTRDTQISLNYHSPRSNDAGHSWAELTIIRTRRAGKSQRRMRDHLISNAMIRDFDRLYDLIKRRN